MPRPRRKTLVREAPLTPVPSEILDQSPDWISTVTDGIVAEVSAWQTRPLDPMYPVVFFDALRVKIRDEATEMRKACLSGLGDSARWHA
jgi:transposase-like protein